MPLEPTPRRRRWPAIVLAAGVLAAAGVATAVLQGAGHSTSSTAAAASTPTATVPSTPVAHPVKHPGAKSPTDVAVNRMIRANATFRQASTKGKLVALTFDDGPSIYTAPLVRELRQLKAPATFFEIGQQIGRYTTLVHNMSTWGFAIEDHTWNHPDLTTLPNSQVQDQLLWTKNKIHKATGVYPQFFRPPYGSQNARVRHVGGILGMVVTLWDIDTRDWTRPGTAAIIGAAEQVHAGGIILMHDGGGLRTETLAAVPVIVRYLRTHHFTLVTIPQLLTLAPPPHPAASGLATIRSGA